MRNRASLVLICAATLAGCAGTPVKVSSLGQDAYQLSVSGTRVQSQADTNARALVVAMDYCSGMGKQLMFRSSQETGEYAWSPKREDLTFVCKSTSDPAYMQAGMRRELDAVVARQ
jgi:hypothetical protein